MSTDAQVEALVRVAERYEDWADASRQLEVALEAASDKADPPPIAALKTDYAAQRALTRAVLAFAAACEPDGPELDGLIGPAFVLGLYQAGTAARVRAELADLDTAMAGWWQAVATVATVQALPPARPQNAAFSRIIDAASDWRDCVAEHETDQMQTRLTDQGATVTRFLTPTMSGFHAQITLDPAVPRDKGPEPEAIGTVRRDSSLGGHLSRFWRPPLHIVVRGGTGDVDVLSTHWTGGSAWKAAHKARLSIDPQAWIELREWTFRGYKLVDVLPYLDSAEVTEDGSQLVFGVVDPDGARDGGTTTYSIGVIGAVTPSSRGWMIAVRVRGGDELRQPRLFDSFYPTLEKATAGVQELYDSQAHAT